MLFCATKSLVGHENAHYNANYPFNSCAVWAGFLIHPEKGDLELQLYNYDSIKQLTIPSLRCYQQKKWKEFQRDLFPKI